MTSVIYIPLSSANPTTYRLLLQISISFSVLALVCFFLLSSQNVTHNYQMRPSLLHRFMNSSLFSENKTSHLNHNSTKVISDYEVNAYPFLSNTSFKQFLNSTGRQNSTFVQIEKNKKIEQKVFSQALSLLKDPAENPVVKKARHSKCIVVGSGSCLRSKRQGSFIDSFPVVIRLNKAPIKGYEKDVGSKTDLRVLYPESAPTTLEFYQGEGAVAVALFKEDDINWVSQLIQPSLRKPMKFWQKSPLEIPVKADKIMIINPEISEQLFNRSNQNQNTTNSRSTTGFVAVQVALNMCRSVTIAGFCYGLNSMPNSSFMYYYGNEKMPKRYPGVHSKSNEPELRRKLFSSGRLTVL